MTLSEFQTLADAVQAIAVASAVGIGGVWALYRFWSLGELAKAKAEIESLRRSLQEQGTVNIALSTRTVRDPSSGLVYVIVRCDCSNIGSRSEVLNLASSRLWNARLRGHQNGVPLFEDWQQTPLVDNTGTIPVAIVLAPQSTEGYEFAIPIHASGLYFMVLILEGSPEESTEALKQRQRLGSAGGLPAWSAMTWIAVDLNKHEKSAATMRSSEPGGCAPVAIQRPRGPGR